MFSGVNGGTLNWSGTLSNFGDPLTLSSGTLMGSTNFTVAGTFNWTGGLLSGSGTTTIGATGVLNINSSGVVSMQRMVINNGNHRVVALVRELFGLDERPGAGQDEDEPPGEVRELRRP